MPISPKYRELTTEELQELEKEFIDFLIINGITAEDWVKIKDTEPEKANDFITLFSDVVFEDIMRKIQYLEKRFTHELMTFHCLKDRMVLVAIKTEQEGSDFTNADFIQQSVQLTPPDMLVYTTEKKYLKQREVEIFEMIQSGCEISDGKLFKALSLAL